MSTIVLQHIAVYEIRFQDLREFFRVMAPGGLLSFQMGFGEGQGKAEYHDNHYEAQGTNSLHDTKVTDPWQIGGDLEQIGFGASATRSGRRSTTATRPGSTPRPTSPAT